MGKFSLLMALLGTAAVVLSHCAASDRDGRTADERASGARDTTDAALTSPPRGSEERQLLGNYPLTSGFNRPQRCPLCDSSVYPYCGEKLLHDACCCTESQHHQHNDLPYQCRLADCRFLHANTCKEHRLIANCCCSDDYRALLRALFLA